MPAITFDEFFQNIQNWMNDNNAGGERGHADDRIRVTPASATIFVQILEEWEDFLTSIDPRVVNLRHGVSLFCAKIVDSKKVDVGVRARASKFLISNIEKDLEDAIDEAIRAGWGNQGERWADMADEEDQRQERWEEDAQQPEGNAWGFREALAQREQRAEDRLVQWRDAAALAGFM